MSRITREELLTSEEYLVGNIQFDLYNDIKQYLERNSMTQTDFAKELNVTKGYVSQILNGDFDHKLSRLIRLYKSIGVAVTGLQKVEMKEYIAADVKEYEKLELIPIDIYKAHNRVEDNFEPKVEIRENISIQKATYQNGFTGYTERV
ncbi:MAG: helix-turn-helix transcriptional regulator [Saprospiraceae bacterium]